MSTFYNLPQAEKVLTHFVVREDAQILYGFGTADEQAANRQLIKIAGVGPLYGAGRALGHERERAGTRRCRSRKRSPVVKIPGIGKKTAERLLLELKGKLGDALGAGSGSAQPASDAQAGASGAARTRLQRQGSAATLKTLPKDVGVSGASTGARTLAK